jgi:gluconate 2-dehydrogenase subunit 3-like protein/TAT (twin-arginine translocation) pathway-exported protein
MSDHENELSRRDVIKLGAAATAAVSLGVGHVEAQARVGGFLTESEFAMLDELSEMIIPTDDHSPGARAAKVAAFIDSQLAEAWEEQDRTDWRAGLALVERISADVSGAPFMKSSPEQRLSVLTRMAQNESKPEKPEEQFFKELKGRVIYAYYTSEIGIKQDMEYKGNTYQTEFAGYDVSKER